MQDFEKGRELGGLRAPSVEWRRDRSPVGY